MKEYTNETDRRVYAEIAAKFPKGLDVAINTIIDVIVHRATEAYLSAAYSGAHNDGGSRAIQKELEAFLDGITYARTGRSMFYESIVRQYKNEQDAEYKEYQRLCKKFGKKEPAAFSN